MGQYELSASQWQRIEGFLPGRPGYVGVTARDNRSFVNGVLWVLRSGAQWKDLPQEYGNWKSVHKRFTRWARSGIWQRIFDVPLEDKDNSHVMTDSTIVRVHQQAAGGKGGPGSGSWALPRGTDHQDTHGVRRPGTAHALCADRRAGGGRASGHTTAGGDRNRSRDCRQRIREQPDNGFHTLHGRGGGNPAQVEPERALGIRQGTTGNGTW